jgi:hypothetical protein
MKAIINRSIRRREALLDRLSASYTKTVLNGAGDPTSKPGQAVAAELKTALDKIKTRAFMQDGAYVDYARLRDSRAYLRFRRELSPALRVFDPAILSSDRERIAFWINLYNALVIDAVIQFGVSKSVREGRLGILAFFRRAAGCARFHQVLFTGRRTAPLVGHTERSSSNWLRAL